MKTSIYRPLALTLLATLALASCKDTDQPDPNRHVLKPRLEDPTAFDQWLGREYTDAYNVQVLYAMQNIESDRSRNLAPAELEKSMKLSQIVLHAWYGAYNEATGGTDFMRGASPRQLSLIGSAMWNGDGTITQGTAEGGLKVTLFQVNWLNENDPVSLNKTFFKVMHHEFSHILHQNKIWPDEYNTISASDYSPTSWYNRRTLADYAPKGFVTAYASSQPREDIAEVTAALITFSDAEWSAIFTAAGEEGKAKLLKKINIIKTYMKNTWKIDMDALRAISLRRLQEIPNLQLIKPEWEPLLRGLSAPRRSAHDHAQERTLVWSRLLQDRRFLDLTKDHTPGDARCQIIPQYTD